MLRFLCWRLVQSLVVLWAIYTVTFYLLMLAPGDPFVGEKKKAEVARAAMAQKYGLDYLVVPAAERKNMSTATRLGYINRAYVRYLGRALRGDLGLSIENEDWQVADIIGSALPVSATLGSVALLIALWAGVAAGTLGAVSKSRHGRVGGGSGWRVGGIGDLVGSFITLLGVSLPTFVVGSLLIMLFVVALPVLPAGGWGGGGGGGGTGLAKIILPAVTLALFFLAYIARLTRSSTLDVLTADFVRTARAKGLSHWSVLTRHVGANAALPVLSYLGPAAANILVGSFVVEKLFAIPGLGTHFVNACLNKDIPLVLGSVLIYSVLVVAFNFLVDIAYAAVDPRIRLQ